MSEMSPLLINYDNRSWQFPYGESFDASIVVAPGANRIDWGEEGIRLKILQGHPIFANLLAKGTLELVSKAAIVESAEGKRSKIVVRGQELDVYDFTEDIRGKDWQPQGYYPTIDSLCRFKQRNSRKKMSAEDARAILEITPDGGFMSLESMLRHLENSEDANLIRIRDQHIFVSSDVSRKPTKEESAEPSVSGIS
jgi:hypothetical protein